MAALAALVGAGLSKLAHPERAEALPQNVISEQITYARADTAILNDGTSTTTQILTTETNAANAIFASRVNNSSTQGRFGVFGSIGSTTFSIPSNVVTAGVWGVSTNNDGAFGVKGEVLGYGAGVYGNGRVDGIGIWGDATKRAGVFGTSTTNVGIFGVSSASSPTSTTAPALPSGVAGQGFGRMGVQGISDTSSGVSGQSTSAAGVFGTSVTAFGVQGLSTNAYGVSGNSTTQAGVWGSSNNNVGVLGSSLSGVGINGISVSSNGVNALSTSGIGIYAASTSGPAGRFDGDVLVNGNLTVSGSFPHSAAVSSADGTLRRLHSLEVAEAFYEDVGQGSLINGIGVVTLDADFAALVRTDSYQIFLTAYGDNNGLYVNGQTASGFDVREARGGTSSIGFGYRLLARPRGAASQRLDRVTVPPPPAQPRLDRVEPLDVPATLRDVHQGDRSRVTDGR
jgi:hypothetical protein